MDDLTQALAIAAYLFWALFLSAAILLVMGMSMAIMSFSDWWRDRRTMRRWKDEINANTR